MKVQLTGENRNRSAFATEGARDVQLTFSEYVDPNAPVEDRPPGMFSSSVCIAMTAEEADQYEWLGIYDLQLVPVTAE